MRTLAELFRPPSVGVAVLGATLSGVAVIGIGIASLTAGHNQFSSGIGGWLIGYAILVLLGAWCGWRRYWVARPLIVVPALIHLATAISLLTGGDVLQRIGAGLGLVVFAATAIAGCWPSTYQAFTAADRPQLPE